MFEFSKTHNANKPAEQAESDLSRKKKTKFNMRLVQARFITYTILYIAIILSVM